MTLSNAPYSTAPDDFYTDTTNELIRVIKLNKNIQLVAPLGSGKSLFLRHLTTLPSPEIKYVYLDFAFLHDHTTSSLVAFLNPHLQVTPTTRVVLLFDSFNTLLTGQLPPIESFNWLCGIHNQFRGHISFVFATDFPIIETQTLLSLGAFGNLLSDHLLYLPPLSQTDIDWFVGECLAQSDQDLSPHEIAKLVRLSGGHMQTLKRLIETHGEDSTNPRMAFHLERLYQSLAPHLEKTALLQKMSILNHAGEYTNQVLGDYIKIKQNSPSDLTEQLTSSEALLYTHLLNHQSNLCLREELISLLWGTAADTNISDHALDQLIHRLKIKLAKLSPTTHIATIRGRGHKLTIYCQTRT